MRVAVALVLSSSIALAEQPRGTYTLDRSSLTHMNDANGNRHPSCGGEKLFGGQATFVVDYTAERILVNQREWRFEGHAVNVNSGKSRRDAPVIIADPESKDRIAIWFWVSKRAGITKGNEAEGRLTVDGTRDGKHCVDAWQLDGKYAR